MRRLLIPATLLLLTAAATPVYAGSGLPKVASMEVGAYKADLYTDSMPAQASSWWPWRFRSPSWLLPLIQVLQHAALALGIAGPVFTAYQISDHATAVKPSLKAFWPHLLVIHLFGIVNV
jgi:hypothetical protein